MATKLRLSSLKNAELKQLARLIGSANSGTKPALTASICRDLAQARLPRPSGQTIRLMSIDMGIRNLAFCVLDISSTPRTTPSKPAPTDTPTPAHLGKILPPALRDISLIAWRRLEVSPAQLNLPSPPSLPPTLTLPEAKEAFDPATFARLAYALVDTILLPYAPTIVLIERQRHRSSGSPAIAEWTVRVNMFECMLHAVFETLRRRGVGGVDVYSVDPKRVSGFWVEGEDGNGEDEKAGVEKGKKKNSKAVKEAKIRIAGEWLRGGLVVGEGAEGMRRAFVELFNKKMAKRRAGVGDGRSSCAGVGGEKGSVVGDDDQSGGKAEMGDLVKLDDLADCLLQGVAWTQWEMNKRGLGCMIDVDG